MPLLHCKKCHHEWEGTHNCDWCGEEGYVIQTTTPLENLLHGDFMKKIKVFLGKEKKKVEVDLVEDRGNTCLVKLPDGNIIKRKKKTQVVPDET